MDEDLGCDSGKLFVAEGGAILLAMGDSEFVEGTSDTAAGASVLAIAFIVDID